MEDNQQQPIIEPTLLAPPTETNLIQNIPMQQVSVPLETIIKTPVEGRTKRHFSYDEDQRLKALVEQYGTNQWGTIAKELGNRNPRQVRDRYRNYLAPDVVKAEWTIQEDKTLIALCQTHGKVWAQLTKYFPGRTDVDLKNHFNKLNRHAQKIQPGSSILLPAENDIHNLTAPVQAGVLQPPEPQELPQ